MKRPFAVAGFGYAAALAAFFTAGIGWPLVAAAAVLPAVWFVIGRKIVRAVSLWVCIVLFAVTAAAFVAYMGAQDALSRSLELCTREGAALDVTVRSHVDYPNGTLYRCRVDAADGERVSNTSLSFFSAYGLEDGRRYTLAGEFTVYRADAAEGLSLDAEGVRPVRDLGVSAVTDFILRTRRAADGAIRRYLDGEGAALCLALITGDRSGLSLETRLSFSRTGIVHILAVSGLHISILFGCLAGLFKRLGVGVGPTVVLLGSFGVFACLFYGMTPSVMRACIMGMTGFAGDALVRRQDAANTMGLAALAVLLPFPGAVTGASFLLSFGCCGAIRLVFPALERRMDGALPGEGLFARAARGALKAAALSVTVNLCILPVLMLFDMELSLVAAVMSPLAVAAVGALMPLILLLCALSGVRALALAPALLCRLLSGVILGASGFLSGLAFASIPARSPWTAACFAGCLVLVIINRLSRGRVSARLTLVCCCAVVLCAAGSFWAFGRGRTVLTVYRDDGILLTRGGRSAAVLYTSSQNDMLYIDNYLRLHFAETPEHVIISRANVGLAAERAAQVFEGCAAVGYGELEGEVDLLGFSVETRGRYAVLFTAPDGTTVLALTRDDLELLDELGPDVVIATERERGYTVYSGGAASDFESGERSSYIVGGGTARRVD